MVSADDGDYDEEEAEKEELERVGYSGGEGRLGCEPAKAGWSAKGVSSDTALVPPMGAGACACPSAPLHSPPMRRRGWGGVGGR